MGREILARGPREPRVHRARDDGLRGVPRSASRSTRSSTPSARRACRPRRSATSRTPTRRPTGAALLDARHHRAPQRGRQRLRADQPVAPDRPRRPLGLGRLPAARPEQRAGRRRHGRAARTSCPAARTSRTRQSRAKFERAWGASIPPKKGWHLSQMFEAMEHGELTALYVIGENPAQSEADQKRAIQLLEGLEHLVVQDMFLTKTAEIADVVLPGRAPRGARPRAPSPPASGACSACARRSSRRGRRATDLAILCRPRAQPRRATGASRRPKQVWDELRALSPWHGGMSYARLEELGGLAVAVPRRVATPAARSSTAGSGRSRSRGRAAPFNAVEHDPPVDRLTRGLPDPADDRPAARLLQHRRADRRATRRPCGAARRSTSRPRTARASASPTASSCASSRAAARSRCPRATTRRCARASPS